MQLACEGHSQIGWVTPGMQVVQNRPTVHPEPVLEPATDADRMSTSIYGSVLRDNGLYRMWYQAVPANWEGAPQGFGVGCVESDDGFEWRRPNYGALEVCGSKQNHITDLPLHCPSVFVDSTAPAPMRYRAFGWTKPDPSLGETVKRRGYYTAHSADGIHWKLDSDEPLYEGHDVITSVWNPFTDSALVVSKRLQWIRGIPRRVHWTSRWTRDSFTEPESALVPDEFDDVVAVANGFNSADYYGVGLFPTPGATIGFLWHFRHQLPLSSGNVQYGIFGRIDISLIYQIEHRGKWQHFPGRAAWLSGADMPEWGEHGLCTAAFPLEVADETRLYITGSPHRHGSYLDSSWNPDPQRTAMMRERGQSVIGMVSWPTGRLLGFQAPLLETMELTPAAASSSAADSNTPKMVLNVVTAQTGRVRVALVDEQEEPIAGFSFEDCEPISGDHRQAVVRWENGPQLLANETVKVRIEITRGTLWAFEFVT